MLTYQANKMNVEKHWYLVDADNKVLGRLASQVASILSGKTKPVYTPHVDTGDYVIIVNAKKIKLTGRKLADKVYHHYSGYPGGLKTEGVRNLLQEKPEEVIRTAVRGMLPKNRLGRKMLKKLVVYPDAQHPHQAQQPEKIEL
ncbi:MAG TPA: 50S ribosomal protein L13 [Thermodesulfobacteriota bacterium]|nr:50S ribosomal protein L13 [Deltaproteobacteria bacterium]HNR14085.1 50S ribosomal protein L13 [Thermodesulfobacteriota bacterium]HNU72487.1 50S ribosomal protein L13 [Thermodesulfobacteriota bacterium]HQO77016.1 50S ribosomal protein L13 [Thermodesulfobacteriota bacterium]